MMPGPAEMLVLLVLVMLFFGAGKLPEVFRSLGQGIKSFRDAQLEDDEAEAEVVRQPKKLAKSEVADAEEVSDAGEVRESAARKGARETV